MSDTRAELAARLRFAVDRIEARLKKRGDLTRWRMSQEALGAEVSRFMLEGSMSQPRVSRMFAGSDPSWDEMVGIALAANLDPGWLAFGPLTKAPAPASQSASSITITDNTGQPAPGATVIPVAPAPTKRRKASGR